MRGLLPGAVIAWLACGAATAHERFIGLACEPLLPAYCANIHIGCSGRSRLKTGAFMLEVNQREGRWYRGPSSVGGISSAHGYDVVFRPEGTRGWIRVEMGQGWGPYPYSERIYRDGRALMSRGRCWHAKAERFEGVRRRALNGQ